MRTALFPWIAFNVPSSTNPANHIAEVLLLKLVQVTAGPSLKEHWLLYNIFY